MNTSSPHIEFSQMANVVTGHLSEDESLAVQEHLATCDSCGLQFSRLERLVEIMREDLSEDAPTYAISNAFRAYDAYFRPTPRVAEQPSAVQRLLAILRLDSSALSPSFGTRSVGAVSDRQLLFHAGEMDFDIRISPAESDKWLLSGQVFNLLEAGELELTDESGQSFRTALSPQFHFSFPPVSAGSYKLKLHSAKIEVETPEIKMGF